MSRTWLDEQPVCPDCESDASCFAFELQAQIVEPYAQFTRWGDLVVRVHYEGLIEMTATCDVCGWSEEASDEQALFHELATRFMEAIADG